MQRSMPERSTGKKPITQQAQDIDSQYPQIARSFTPMD